MTDPPFPNTRTDKIFLPDIRDEEVARTIQEELFRLIRDSPHQQRDRSAMTRHLFLDQAADQKAKDMAAKNYLAHTSPSGVSANQNVRMTGYRLPDWYPVEGNNVESLYLGSDGFEDVITSWLTSDRHRSHVFGQNDFFRSQNCIGVGYTPFPKEEHRGYFCFISAPCI